MELFKNTNYDFLGKKWPFIIASLVLTVAGFSSIALKGGLKYGIDFKYGALIQVKFAYQPPDNKIRAAMLDKIKGKEVTVQDLSGGVARDRFQSLEMIEIVPFTRLTRSRILISPIPWSFITSSTSKPTPQSRTVSRIAPCTPWRLASKCRTPLYSPRCAGLPVRREIA